MLNPSATLLYAAVSFYVWHSSDKSPKGHKNDELRAMAASLRMAALINSSFCDMRGTGRVERPVTNHYRIPHVSIGEALNSSASASRADWYLTAFSCDNYAHITVLGQ